MIGITRRRTGTNDSAKLLDILYADANGNLSVDSGVLPVSAGKVPIGICIAPDGFFGYNEPARFISLKFMSYSTPETGSLSSQTMYWGNFQTDIFTIDNITVTHNGGAGNGYFTADWITTTSNKIPSLFDANGRWNISVLGAVNQYAVTDIDGKNKTDKILATVTSTTWRTASSITNSSTKGAAPAACCCARYHTLGTQAGDWYLGAVGEISPAIELRDQINIKLAQLNAIYPNYCISSMGTTVRHCSTEYNGNSAYGVNFNNGRLNYFAKNTGRNVTAMIQLNKKSSNNLYVDFGLPSGLLWAKGNIVKDANDVYAIGEPTDYGCYFSWGNIYGNDYENYEDTYYYEHTNGGDLSSSISSNDNIHDAALANLGAPWHLPTQTDFVELYNNTDQEWTTIDGVNGLKVMKKTDHSVYIFVPAAGYGTDFGPTAVNTKGYYWSSTLYNASTAHALAFTSSTKIIGSYNRYLGYSVRAVASY